MEIVLIQVFEVIVNTSYDVSVFNSNGSYTLSLSGDELFAFLSNLDDDTIVEYPLEFADSI